MFDLIIIGGGPAGSAAAVYAARKRLKTAVIVKSWGGQSIDSMDVQNWIGTPHIPGPELAKAFKAHVEEYKDEVVTVFSEKAAVEIHEENNTFSVTLDSGEVHTAKAVLVTTGSARKKLPAEGADVFEHKGVTYCASCDGPLFSGMDVAVIGGGNAGFETAAQLLAYCKSVTLLDIHDDFKADPITVEAVLKHPNMKALHRAQTTKILGDKMVSGLVYRDMKSDVEHQLSVQGIFVEIGQLPATDFLGSLVAKDSFGRIIIDHKTNRTSKPGLWAAGDCTDVLYHQNNIAAGDAVRALEDIYLALSKQ